MKRDVVWQGDTPFGYFEVVDTQYDGRQARVLYSADGQAAQSGIATDDESDLLFDYNQRMLELAMNMTPESVLIIGGGAGTIATALLWALPDVHVDIVEPNRMLTELAHRYFGLPTDGRLRVFTTDGRSYLASAISRYDMIMVDAFDHTTIPANLKTLEAFQAYYKHMNRTGLLTMNVISGYHGPSGRTLRQLSAAADQTFDDTDIFLASSGYTLWLPQNFVLAAQKGTDFPLRDYVRHDAVQPLAVTPADALHDN